ncbi:MAG: DNA translocase FtsK 4TM domain-containing protein [Christensenellales bacterium]|jgi:S-DNA-T family DNA segregation ATPase FtsK/SpoIIIE
MAKTTATKTPKNMKRTSLGSRPVRSASPRKPTKKELAQLEAKKQRQQVLRREVVGILLAAAGIFCLLSILSLDMGLLGAGFQSFLFGMFGAGAFIVPIAIIACGIVIIIARKQRISGGKIIAALLLAVSLLIFGHLLVHDKFQSTSLGAYSNQGYQLGRDYGFGTGALGASLAYIFVKYAGITGSYVISITAMLCCLLALTRISIAKVSEQVGSAAKSTAGYISSKHKEHVEQREQREAERARLQPIPLSAEKVELYSEVIADSLPGEGGIPLPGIDEMDMMDVGELTFELDRREKAAEIIPDEGENSQPAQADPDKEKTMIAPLQVHMDIKPVFEVAKETAPASGKTLLEVAGEGEVPPYRYPSVDLLNEPSSKALSGDPQAEMERGARTLEETLASFGISAKVVHVSRGPAITRFELTPAPGVKVSRITSLSDDIALNLAAYGVRIEAPIPGKQAIGIEIPNSETSMVTLRETLTNEFFHHKSNIVAAIGKDITGSVMLCDLARMPHLLIAGATGSGKSVCINTIIASILFKSSPEDVRFIMIDPKVVELNVYNGIPHLLIPVVTDPKKASGALGWAVQEMTDRYKKFAAAHTRDITGYNEYAEREGLEKMPKIVIIIDELADLMAVAPGEVEERIQRLAQLARAAGMHLVIATQRPSVNVITGVIKANIPSRIAFSVASQVDSRTILDMAGAEKLLGKGDMLYNPAGVNKPIRVQGAFISEDEVERLTDYIKNGEEARYSAEIEDAIESGGEKKAQETAEDEVDEKLVEAIEIAVDSGQVSISMLQRKLEIGYPRAGKLIDAMERRGLISGHEGSKPRQTLLTRHEFERQYGSLKGIDEGDDPAMKAVTREIGHASESEDLPF